MIAYGMTDTAPSLDGNVAAGTVSIPVDKGGCGRQHQVQTDDNRRAYVDCDACAPVLIEKVYGWAPTPYGVPLTPDEQGEADMTRREGESAYRMAMKAMGDAAGEIVQGTRHPAGKAEAPKSLVEQIAALPAEDRAELGKLFASDQAAGAADRAAKEQATAPAKPPVRRGRPPKTA